MVAVTGASKQKLGESWRNLAASARLLHHGLL